MPLPCTLLRLTPAVCDPSADRIVPPCWVVICSALKLCSEPGTLSGMRPISESGRVPNTTTCSVAWTVRPCAQDRVGSRAEAASSRTRILMGSPFPKKGLGEDRPPRNFPISRRERELFPNVALPGSAAKMPREFKRQTHVPARAVLPFRGLGPAAQPVGAGGGGAGPCPRLGGQ